MRLPMIRLWTIYANGLEPYGASKRMKLLVLLIFKNSIKRKWNQTCRISLSFGKLKVRNGIMELAFITCGQLPEIGIAQAN